MTTVLMAQMLLLGMMADGAEGESRATIHPKSYVSKSTGITFVLIPSGKFKMGSSVAAEALVSRFGSLGFTFESFKSEFPYHQVVLTRSFYMGIHEVTQAKYALITGRNPSSFARDGDSATVVGNEETKHLPVESVTWYDAVEYCNRLSVQDGLHPYYELSDITREQSISSAKVKVLGGDGYRLPTEAEWEYACRGGAASLYSFGDSAEILDQHGWYGSTAIQKGNSKGRPHTVGVKKANAFGLYDMHGNVSEWCEDFLSDSAYVNRTSGTTDPIVRIGEEPLRLRVYRGGSWPDSPVALRSSARAGLPSSAVFSSIGIRLVRSVPRLDVD